MASVIVRSDGAGSPDYTSLAAALSANEVDIEIQGTWAAAETTNFTINYGSTNIIATGAAKHPGYVGASPTHWRARNTSGHTFNIQADTIITGLDIGSQSSGVSDELFRVAANGVNLKLDSSLLWFNARIDEQDIIYTNLVSDCNIELVNCIGWNAYRAVIDAYQINGTSNFKINSCHFYNCGAYVNRGGIFGLDPAGGTTNCYMFNSLVRMTGVTHVNTRRYTSSGTANIVVDNCIHNLSDYEKWADNFDSETLSNNLENATWTDDDTKSSDGDWIIVNDITNYDFRLAENDYNEAQDWTSATSGAGLTIPSVDMVGTSRPQNTYYDCGAFEIEAGDAPTELTPTGITTGLPVLGSPAIGQTHALTATGFLSGVPAVETPALSQIHILTSIGLTTAPTFDAPVLSGPDTLYSVGLTTTPVLSSPDISQVHSLDVSGIITGAPVVSDSVISQVHGLSSPGLTSSPGVGTSAISQVHGLTATGFLSGVPAVETPALSQIHTLTSIGLTTAPTLEAPVLSGPDTLYSIGLTTIPVLSSPGISQVHVLLADQMAATPFFLSPLLDWVPAMVPDSRVYSVLSETRIRLIINEARIYEINTETRTLTA